MNILDLIILIVLVSALLRGLRVGFFRQLFSFVGFWIGFYFGTLLANHFSVMFAAPTSQLAVSLVAILGSAMILGSIGELIGYRLSHLFQIIHLGWLDRLFGALAGMATTLLTFWLVASLLAAFPVAGLARQVSDSKIIGALNDRLPAPPTILTEIEKAFHFAGFPNVFIGQEPPAAAPVAGPQSEEVQAIAAAVRASVVKVEGLGCGGISAGSGFVASSGLVVTNAHVVAGIAYPTVRDERGVHKATLVLFDPNLDIAILRSSGLSGKTLDMLSDMVPRGTTGAVLGYPEGGPFSAVAAAVLQKVTATGRNIYNEGETTRSIYELQSNVLPGNSGGPLVRADGKVMAVVFAKAEKQEGIGYALTTDQIIPKVAEAQNKQTAVSSGACVAE